MSQTVKSSIMEPNTAILDSLILFYIDMKDNLHTKKLDESAFLEQMIKYCKERGVNSHTDKLMRSIWMNLISKYLYLKANGTTEEKENWKYFEILDSCYDESDFSNNKFSDDIIWLIIECFLKMENSEEEELDVFQEIHDEFLKYGYTHISKRYIKDKWKSLNLKCKMSNFTNIPYLEAVKALQKHSCVVNMAFTKNLTKQLIKYYTQLKIMCIIHGYDSEKVLSEIQSKFKDQRVYFSIEDIKEKWKKLTNIYKFLTTKGKTQSNWIYFNSMRSHFTEEFLNPSITENNNEPVEENFVVKRCLRPRSKSVGLEIYKNSITLEKKQPDENKYAKRSLENRTKTKARKRLKIEETIEEPHLKNIYDVSDTTQTTLNDTKTNVERKLYASEKVHIININEADIDSNSGNLTINIPSITKQFSDNEFLPLKKRLRIVGDTKGQPDRNEGPSETGNQDQEKETMEDTHITQKGIIDSLGMTDNEEVNIKEHPEKNVDNLTSKKLNGNVKVLGDDNQENVLVPKHIASSPLQKSSVVFLVIKMDGTKKFLKKSILDGVDNKTSALFNKQETASFMCDNFVKPTVPKTVQGPRNQGAINCNNKTSSGGSDVIILDDNSAIQVKPTEKTIVHEIQDKSCNDNDIIILDDDVKPDETVPILQNHTKDKSCSADSDVVVLDPADDVVSDCQDHLQDFHFFPGKYNIGNDPTANTNLNLNKDKSNLQCSISEPTVSGKSTDTNRNVKRLWPGFKFVSQVIRGPVTQSASTPKAPAVPSTFIGSAKSSGTPNICGKNEDFDTESVLSEAVGEDEGLKDNLLATVIDFQEQNNSEFIEIKNLMKQNNLLQRETNRLLRLLIEQM